LNPKKGDSILRKLKKKGLENNLGSLHGRTLKSEKAKFIKKERKVSISFLRPAVSLGRGAEWSLASDIEWRGGTGRAGMG